CQSYVEWWGAVSRSFQAGVHVEPERTAAGGAIRGDGIGSQLGGSGRGGAEDGPVVLDGEGARRAVQLVPDGPACARLHVQRERHRLSDGGARVGLELLDRGRILPRHPAARTGAQVL